MEKSCKFCSKTVLIQTFIPNGLKWRFPHIQMGMNHMCQSHITLHYLTFDVDFDFCLTFSWNFLMLHMNMSLCLLYSSLIFDHFYDIKYMFRLYAHDVWEYAKWLKFIISQRWYYCLIHHMLIWIYSWWMHGFEIILKYVLFMFLYWFKIYFLAYACE